VGLSAQPFVTMTMEVVRASPKGKWHVPSDIGRCSHLTRAYGYHPTPLPVQTVSVLGDYDFCSSCLHRVAVPGQAGVLHRVAGLIVAAAAWVTELERLAPGMDWLQVARWSSHTPFDPTDPLPELLAGLVGARGFGRHRAQAQAVWRELRVRTEAALSTAHQAAGPPGLRALAARARDLLLADTDTMSEAYAIEAIAGGARHTLYQPDPGREALDAWLTAVAADGDTSAGHAAMLAAVEARYGHATVRDVSLLPIPAFTPAGGHATPADWAAAEFTEVRRRLVALWCARLNTVLHEAHLHAGDTEQLLLVAGWPITFEPDREIAYLAQYPVVSRTVIAHRHPNSYPPPTEIPWAVVLRVPTFAAEHAAAHRSEYLATRLGAVLAVETPAEDRQVRALLRHAAGYLPDDVTADPPTPLPSVAEWRARAGRGTDLRQWVEDGASSWDLPARWRWIPDIEPDSPGPGSLHVLAQLWTALASTCHPVVVQVAVGEPDELSEAELVVYPHSADPASGILTYRPHDLPGCPTIEVPSTRLIRLYDAW
jgi:hypothetical protein